MGMNCLQFYVVDMNVRFNKFSIYIIKIGKQKEYRKNINKFFELYIDIKDPWLHQYMQILYDLKSFMIHHKK